MNIKKKLISIICNINEDLFLGVIFLLLFGTLGACLYLTTKLIYIIIAIIGYLIALLLISIRNKYKNK